MIPKNITPEDILKAIQKVDTDNYKPNRESDDYDLYFNGKPYPPKVIISYANIFANGEEWPASEFDGGEESNSFLIELGFPILQKETKNPDNRFTKEDTSFFDQYANRPYDSTNPIHKNAGAFIREYIWWRSKEWADRISAVTEFKREGNIHWNERRNNKERQAFKYYSWYQLHHHEYYHDKIFYTVGIEGPRHPDYLSSHLIIKLDCRRSKIDTTMEASFDALLMKHGITWEFIEMHEKEGIDWQVLVNRSLAYINQTFNVYLEAIKQIENNSREMAARITWNDNDWVSPSGRRGKSKSHTDSHEKVYGYTPEEWLLDLEKTIDGYHYARMESLNASHHIGRQYNLTLFANNSEERQWYWVGRITDAEVIDSVTSEAITQEYKRLGWLDEQIWQLEQLENVYEQNYKDWQNAERFNIRFRPEDFRAYELIPFTDNETPPSGHYNLPTLKRIPIFLTTQTDENKEEDVLIYGSEEETGIKGRIKRQFKQQIKELENVHRHVQIGFADYLRKNKPATHKVFTESYKRISKTRIDILEVTAEGRRIFYEVKTYPSTRHSIRAALGQLFEYAYFPCQNLADSFVIVSHLPATPDELKYLAHLENELSIKVDYIYYDWKTKEVIEQ